MTKLDYSQLEERRHTIRAKRDALEREWTRIADVVLVSPAARAKQAKLLADKTIRGPGDSCVRIPRPKSRKPFPSMFTPPAHHCQLHA
jgi:hypothetical protein